MFATLFDSGGSDGRRKNIVSLGRAYGSSHPLWRYLCARRDVCANGREKCRDRRGVFSFDYDFSQGTGLYFQKVVDAGGWKKFEQVHLATLTATFAPKFPMLPPEMVRHILTFGFHAGYY